MSLESGSPRKNEKESPYSESEQEFLNFLDTREEISEAVLPKDGLEAVKRGEMSEEEFNDITQGLTP